MPLPLTAPEMVRLSLRLVAVMVALLAKTSGALRVWVPAAVMLGALPARVMAVLPLPWARV